MISRSVVYEAVDVGQEQVAWAMAQGWISPDLIVAPFGEHAHSPEEAALVIARIWMGLSRSRKESRQAAN